MRIRNRSTFLNADPDLKHCLEDGFSYLGEALQTWGSGLGKAVDRCVHRPVKLLHQVGRDQVAYIHIKQI